MSSQLPVCRRWLRAWRRRAGVSNAIADNNWTLLEKVWSGGDPEGARIKQTVAGALAADELVTSLAAALKQAQRDATAIIAKPIVSPPPEPPPKGMKVIRQDARKGLEVAEARDVLAQIEADLGVGRTLDISYKIVGEDDA